MNFDQLVDHTLNESFSNVGHVDTNEIRTLYYGRIGVMASFSNEMELELSGFMNNRLFRPYGVVAHTIDTVVGRKVRTARFYAHIFRRKGSSGQFVENLNSITLEDYAEAKEAMSTLSYVDEEILYDAIKATERNARLRSGFHRIWELTFLVASTSARKNESDKLWARILRDIGYSGFQDQQGIGVFADKGSPAILILNERDMDTFDIMPIQKYRSDPRERVRYWVNKFNRYNVHKRNRIAKRKTAPHRGMVNKDNDLLKFIRDVARANGRLGLDD